MRDIEWWRLALAALFIALAGGASLALRLRLHWTLLWGAARTLVQIALLGLVLQTVLGWDHPAAIVGVLAGMILFAAFTAGSRAGKRWGAHLLPTAVVMLTGYLSLAFLVHWGVVGLKPWWDPRVFLPLSGMLVGNAMNAVAVGLERLLTGLESRRAEVEAALALGATPAEASAGVFRDAARAGLIPSINSMMAAGAVFIPGVMTGQVMAGADPMEAVKYQVIIMWVQVAAAVIGVAGVLLWVRSRCFTAGWALRRT